MTDTETKQNFIISPPSTTTNPALGEIYTLLIDQGTGQTAENVTLRITDLNGNPVAGEITSSDGIFRIPNVPPGMVNLSVISGEDSGNATLYVYPNGVTYFEFVMTKVIPSRVTVSGTIKDLAGASVVGSQWRAVGRSDVISADGNGDYQEPWNLLAGLSSRLKKMVPTTPIIFSLAPGCSTQRILIFSPSLVHRSVTRQPKQELHRAAPTG